MLLLDVFPVDNYIVPRHYIAEARKKRPTVPPQVSNYIVESYVRLRKHSQEKEKEKKAYTYTSARTLLGVLRLSQALARLRFAETVEHPDVDEALRLMEVSNESLKDDDDNEREPDQTTTSKVYRIIKDMLVARSSGSRKGYGRGRGRLGKGPSGERDMDMDDDDDDNDVLSLVDVRARVLASGFTEEQLNATITEVTNPLHRLLLYEMLITSIHSTNKLMSGLKLRTTRNFALSTSSHTLEYVLSLFVFDHFVVKITCFLVYCGNNLCMESS